MARVMGLELERPGHGTVLVKGSRTVCFDPFVLPEKAPAVDLILVTHEHYDHCAPHLVKRLSRADTAVICDYASATKLWGDPTRIRPGQTMKVKGIEIRAVPAYNTDKFRTPGVPFHPKEMGYLGYLIAMDGLRIYHAGDTDLIPEMKELREVDIALLPVSGKFVMTPGEAAAAAATINPRVAIPIHYGAIVGSESNAKEFAKILESSGIETLLI